MAEKNKTDELDQAIARDYELYSKKRVALATLLGGLLSLTVSLAVYMSLDSWLFATLAFLLVGFIGINVAFLTIVPPASSLQRSRTFIIEAIKEPAKIKSYNLQKVQLADSEGKVHTLSGYELKVWTTRVVPYLIEGQAQREQSVKPTSSQRQLTASERKYIEQRRKEVAEIEMKIEEERKSLERDRRELEIRSNDLNQAEELVIARLTGVEEAEAELEQLKIVAAERADEGAAAYDAKVAEAKAAELRTKEAELIELKMRLEEEHKSFTHQKAELERLKHNVTRSPFPQAKDSSADLSIEAREAALNARKKQLEEEARDLEMRSEYIADSENALIERLDALTEREAHVEQSEIDAGLRED